LSTEVKVNENIDGGNSYRIQITAGRTGDVGGEGYLVTTKEEEKRRQIAGSFDSPGMGGLTKGRVKQAMSNRRGNREKGIEREGARLTGEALRHYVGVGRETNDSQRKIVRISICI